MNTKTTLITCISVYFHTDNKCNDGVRCRLTENWAKFNAQQKKLAMPIKAVLNLAVVVYLILSVKKPSMVNSNSCCYLINGEVPNNIKDTYHAASIWNYQRKYGKEFIYNRSMPFKSCSFWLET